MTFEFRTAQIEERGRLIDLQRRASLANPGDREAILEHPDAVDLPAAQIEAGDVTVATQQGRLVGFSAICIRADGDAELDGLFVEPALWKHGLGRALVDAAAARAAAHGARKLHVIGNPHAEGFYRRAGFTVTGEIRTRFGPGRMMQLDVPQPGR